MRLITVAVLMTAPLFAQVENQAEQFLTLNDEMKLFLQENVQTYHSSRHRLNALVFSVFGEDGLGFTYGNQRTKTPIETFSSRTGNCMSFTTMFVAMAREVGLHAYFQEVEDFPTWDRRGELVINNKHMNVIVMVEGRYVEVDFLPFQDKRRRYTRRINDTKALAHFFNNRGAEAFAIDERDLAREYFEAAIATNPNFARAWSNLGVYWRHEGNLDKAEECYLTAIDHNRYEYTAISNLAYLYDRANRPDLAEKYATKAERHRNRNPYFHYDVGDTAYANGDLQKALASFKKAVHLRPKESEFYHALARVYHDLGDMKSVEKNLKLAQRWALTPDQKLQYSSKLDLLAKR